MFGFSSYECKAVRVPQSGTSLGDGTNTGLSVQFKNSCQKNSCFWRVQLANC